MLTMLVAFLMQMFNRQVVKSESATIKVLFFYSFTGSSSIIGNMFLCHELMITKANGSLLPCLQALPFVALFHFYFSLFKAEEVFLLYLILMFIVQIPELDFEIPPEAQRGSLSTVSPLNLLHIEIFSINYLLLRIQVFVMNFVNKKVLHFPLR